MTGHELARRLLELPDDEVFIAGESAGPLTRLLGVAVAEADGYATKGSAWTPCVVLTPSKNTR